MQAQKVFLAGSLLLCSCASPPSPPPLTIREVQDFQGTFICNDKVSIKMHFEPFKATMELPTGVLELEQKPVAKGFLYVGSGQTLRTGGSDVNWTDEKGTVRQCRDSRVAP